MYSSLKGLRNRVGPQRRPRRRETSEANRGEGAACCFMTIFVMKSANTLSGYPHPLPEIVTVWVLGTFSAVLLVLGFFFRRPSS